MGQWLRRARGAVGLGVVWAVVWAVVAVAVGLAIDPDGSMDEMWPAIGAYPGFLGGVLFSAVLAVAARRRRLHELSLPRVAAWGAAAGLVVGTIPFLVGEPSTEVPLPLLALAVVGSITVLGAASAAGSLAIARKGAPRALPGEGSPVAEIERTGDDAPVPAAERELDRAGGRGAGA